MKTPFTLHHPNLLFLLASSFLLLLAGCQKENIVNPITDPADTTSIPYGNTPAPDWSVNPDYDYASSMTAVVCVDLTQSYTLTPEAWNIAPGDKLAAFVGDPLSGECVGVASPAQQHNLFFLYIVAPQGRDDITLWYYSEKLHNIFRADTSFPFENGSRFGTVQSPATPHWQAQ